MSTELLTQPYTLTLLLVLLLPVAGGIAYWMRRRRLVYAGVDGSGLDRRPSRAIRGVESALLVIAGFSVLALVLMRTRGGYLLDLEKLAPELAFRYWSLASLAFLAVIVASVLAWRGQTRLGLFLVIGAVASHGLHVNAKHHVYRIQNPADLSENPSFTIDFQDAQNGHGSIKGADVWVGEVYLGKTPITTTVNAFWERIGQPQEEPKDYHDESTFVRVAIPNARSYRRDFSTELTDQPQRHWQIDKYAWWNGLYPRFYEATARPWLRIAVPEKVPTRAYRAAVPTYMRAKWKGHEVYLLGGHGPPLSGHLGGTSVVNVVVPSHQAAIQEHLVALRGSAYQTSPAWIDTMLSFGRSGEAVLDYESETAPELKAVYEAVVAAKLARRFGTPESVPRAEIPGIFEQMLETHGSVLGDRLSPESQWLQALAPRLDPTWLVEQLKPIVRSEEVVNRYYQYTDDPWWWALATAALLWDKAAGPGNVLEQDLVTWILRWHPSDGPMLAFAAQLGGLVYETYVARQVALAPDKWSRSACWLTGDLGREIRAGLKDRMVNEANFAMTHGGGYLEEYLFLDGPYHADSLARQYYPHFQRLARREHSGRLGSLTLAYLTRMEPDTPPRLYREAFAQLLPRTHEGHEGDLVSGLRMLARLSGEKRMDVLRALREEALQLDRESLKEKLLVVADAMLAQAGDPGGIDRLLNAPLNVDARWFKEFLHRPPHPRLIRAMEGHSNVRLHEAAARALAKYPFR